LSPRLADRLRELVAGRKADEPLFLTTEGKRLHPDNFSKRKLKPLLDMLGLKGGLHAFRHGNASAMDELGVPMKTRQDRLGHVNPRTTMKYTHKIVDADVELAEQLDELFCPVPVAGSAAKEEKVVTNSLLKFTEVSGSQPVSA
jgi:integrase